MSRNTKAEYERKGRTTSRLVDAETGAALTDWHQSDRSCVEEYARKRRVRMAAKRRSSEREEAV